MNSESFLQEKDTKPRYTIVRTTEIGSKISGEIEKKGLSEYV